MPEIERDLLVWLILADNTLRHLADGNDRSLPELADNCRSFRRFGRGVMLTIGCGFYARLEADRALYIEASLKRIDVTERTGRACPGAVKSFRITMPRCYPAMYP